MTTAPTSARQHPTLVPTRATVPPPLWFLRLVSTLVVLLVLSQRIGVPVGGTVVSLAVPFLYAFVAIALSQRLLVVSRLRAELYALAVSGIVLSTAAVYSLGYQDQASLTSLGLLIVLYLPWVLRVRDPWGTAVVTRAGRTFIWTALGLSVVGVAQLAAQLAGVWDGQDYLGALVPSSFRIPDYNFTNELSYGLGIYKATAFVVLEPSFLSQFCALAILIGIMLKVRTWKLLVLAAGLGAAVSGTGLILLGAGAVLLLVRAPRRIRIGYVVTGVIAAVAILASPVASFLLSRQNELTTPGTSGDARFVAPYQAAWKGLLDEPLRFLIGAGPGSVDRIIPGEKVDPRGGDILYSVIPKLAFEYGIIAGGVFALFLVLATIDRAPWRVVPAALVVMTFALSGGLLQPQTAVLAWLLAGIGASLGERKADGPAVDGRGALPRDPATATAPPPPALPR